MNREKVQQQLHIEMETTMSVSGVSQNPLLNNVAHAVIPARAMATAASGASGAAITSTDFMKLLVTEMKNQDPTQPTDPNAYIQQLVGVNSLQQLIAINGELGATTNQVTGA